MIDGSRATVREQSVGLLATLQPIEEHPTGATAYRRSKSIELTSPVAGLSKIYRVSAVKGRSQRSLGTGRSGGQYPAQHHLDSTPKLPCARTSAQICARAAVSSTSMVADNVSKSVPSTSAGSLAVTSYSLQ